MKAAIYRTDAKHHISHSVAMAEGLMRHGINSEFFNGDLPDCDFAVTWGWRKGETIRRAGKNVLVMERGYLGDRFNWTSLGWNGLNGRAEWNSDNDPARFNSNYGHLIGNNYGNRDGYILIIGQVPGDASIKHVDINSWYRQTYNEACKLNIGEVKFRAHPEAIKRGYRSFMPSMNGDLQTVLKGAKLVITYNSNTGVDAVVNGVPVIVSDIGGMAFEIANKRLDTISYDEPNRNDWFARMAWRQWSIDEIASGLAWDHVKRSDFIKPDKNIVALVIGGGKDVWKETEQAFNNFDIDIVIAINNSIEDWPGKIDAAITLHPIKMGDWLQTRKERGYSSPGITIAHKDRDRRGVWPISSILDYRWPEMVYSGSSGLYAVKAAFELFNATKVILAGVPMEPTQAHYHKAEIWNDANSFWPAWKATYPRLVGKVKSYSGATANLLGKPTKEWIND